MYVCMYVQVYRCAMVRQLSLGGSAEAAPVEPFFEKHVLKKGTSLRGQGCNLLFLVRKRELP